MREALAERLLAQVMAWTPEDVARERPLLQALAALKYDEYQQFGPGMRFVESLALWLQQFNTEEERCTAYAFVKSRLIFFSTAEIAHLVTTAYPDHVRPILLRRAAKAIGLAEMHITRIVNTREYRALRRQCLFLGLSDGARIDTFRRSTNPELTHEQIWQTYEMSPEKGNSLLFELRKDLQQMLGPAGGANISLFQMVFLLDDFSGSGRTYIRKQDDGKELTGKIVKFKKQLDQKGSGLNTLACAEGLYVGIVLYIATTGAEKYLTDSLAELSQGSEMINFGVHVVHPLDERVGLCPGRDAGFLHLVDRDSYYDPNALNEATRKGGTNDLKRGFAGCALPVVLSHNTPNNSVFLIYAEEQYRIRGLFPRVSRHRSES